MTVNVNAAGLQQILSGEQPAALSPQDKSGQDGKGGLSIFAGQTNMTSQSIEDKLKEGRKKAMDVINEAWDADKSVDKMVDDRKGHYQEQEALFKEAQENYNNVKSQMDELGERYADKQDPEYLEQVGGLRKQAEFFQGQMEDARKEMMQDTLEIRTIARDRLKEHPMVDAQKSADDIMAATNKEVIGMAADAAKEHIDEKFEEDQEKAEKLKEKKEEQEEFIEAVKEKAAEAEGRRKANADDGDVLEDMLENALTYDGMKDIKATVEEIKDSYGMLEVDLLGLKVDEQS